MPEASEPKTKVVLRKYINDRKLCPCDGLALAKKLNQAIERRDLARIDVPSFIVELVGTGSLVEVAYTVPGKRNVCESMLFPAGSNLNITPRP